jgi:putative ABC transport system permease protein
LNINILRQWHPFWLADSQIISRMLRNYFLIALRKSHRQLSYTFINITGLATGLACALLIFLWVNDESSYNQHIPNRERVYQIFANVPMTGSVSTWENTPGPLGPELATEVPEMEAIARVNVNNGILFRHGDKAFSESGLIADEAIFELMGAEIIQGNSQLILENTSTVALAESLARKLFGEENALGQMVKIGSRTEMTVGAIYRDLPEQSTLRGAFVLPLAHFYRPEDLAWGNYDFLLFARLKPDTQADRALDNILSVYQNRRPESETFFVMQPITDSYLYSQFENGQPVGGRIQYIRIFTLVGIFILLLACINFMNLATARAASRGKEVGIRKTIGAQRKSLIVQFLMESVVTALFALGVALVLVEISLPLFNQLVEKSIFIDYGSPSLIGAFISIALVAGILAGSYPAFFLSAFRPSEVLKGSQGPRLTGEGLRKSLVIFQFTISMTLLVSSLVFYKQVEFIRNKNLGYDKENIITMTGRADLVAKFQTFREEVLANKAIVEVSAAGQHLMPVSNSTNSVDWPGKPDGENSQIFFRAMECNYNFHETVGMKLVEGQFFTRDITDTTVQFIVTEEAVRTMGLTDPIGTTISLWGAQGVIRGVVGDFHSQSLHSSIDPIVFGLNPDQASIIYLKLAPGQSQEALAHMEALYKGYVPGFPFEYRFMDENFAVLYKSEIVTGKLAAAFTGMAMLISCLGLLGLAAFTAEKRLKEIGIRKVLGASVVHLVLMLSRDFAKLSLAAILLGSGIAYWAMSRFLEGFAFHIHLSVALFALAGVFMLSITLITVTIQTGRAARTNPATVLKSE